MEDLYKQKCFDIIGLGMGPWLVGVLSDALMPTLGTDSLRYAMLYLLPPAMTWSVVHFFFAAKHLEKDLANAPE